MTVTATKQGRLSLKIEGEDGVFSTHYPDLRVPVYRDDTLPWQRGDSALLPDTASVRVDLRRLGLFLSAELGQSKRAIANLVDTEMLTCEERVRIPGIIHMEGEEEDTDQVILSSDWSGLLILPLYWSGH